eukprot:scaffold26242_cov50-Attheya_sp.AAC.6
MIRLAQSAIQPLIEAQGNLLPKTEEFDDYALAMDLGRPFVPIEETNVHSATTDRSKQDMLYRQVIEEAYEFIHKKLEPVALRLFGVDDASTPNIKPYEKYAPVNIHEASKTSPLVSKHMRGRREHLIRNEICRLFRDDFKTKDEESQLLTEEEEKVIMSTTPPIPVTVESLQKMLDLERKRSFDMHTHLMGEIHALQIEQQKMDPPIKSTLKATTPTATATSNDKGPDKREAASMAVYKSDTNNIHSNGPLAKPKSDLKQQQQQKEKEKETPVLTVRQIQWNKRFDEIVAFKETHGHSNVPWTEQYMSLANWVYSQRCKHTQIMEEGKESGLDQIRRLHSIGFSFQNIKSAKMQWNKRFGEIVAFKETHGHSNVPWGEEYYSLAKWVHSQRSKHAQMMEEGKESDLYFDLDQIHQLRSIGEKVSSHSRTD